MFYQQLFILCKLRFFSQTFNLSDENSIVKKIVNGDHFYVTMFERRPSGRAPQIKILNRLRISSQIYEF